MRHFLRKPEKHKTLYVDPGESAGWCLANGPRLLAAGTTPLWEFADEVWTALDSKGKAGILGSGQDALPYTRKGVGSAAISPTIGRIVCEDFRVYPNKARALIWDPIRTLRLIGAITMASRWYDIPMFLQPAAIKPSALALGAEEYYYAPAHENRHQNDAIQHFVYFRAFGPDGDKQVNERVSADERKD